MYIVLECLQTHVQVIIIIIIVFAVVVDFLLSVIIIIKHTAVALMNNVGLIIGIGMSVRIFPFLPFTLMDRAIVHACLSEGKL